VSTGDLAEVTRQVRAASTSFYGAMRILDKPRREAIFAIYAFCRAVDDIADDEDISAGERTSRLKQWRRDIADLFSGNPSTTITRSLASPISTFGLKQGDFNSVIDGMQMDADGPIVAPSAAELDLYCDRVASAVGRLCVCIFGEPGPDGIAVARHLGRALQLTNILRDVDEDARIGRLYLPRELLDKHGIAFTDPMKVMPHAAYPALWREMAGQASNAFESAEAALKACSRRRMRPARIMLEVYRRNLMRMMALSDDDLANPDFSKRLVGKPEKIMIALRHAIF